MKANVSPHHSQTIHSNSCSGLLQQIHAYQDELTTSPSSHDVLEIALAVACSLDISKSDDSALLWIMIAGVPSADKTATVLSLRELSCIKLLDTLTENALASGYINPHQPSQSPDLLPQLKDKCVIIKDLTTLFSMRDDKVKKILGDLSSIFDGSFHKHTGTRGAIDYTDIAFSMIACITTAALADHHRYLSTIGPRFLTYAFLPLNQPEREAGFDLLHKSNRDRKAKLQQLRQLVATLGNQILATPASPMSIPDHLFKDLKCLATLLACGRSAITYRFNEDSHKREIEHIQTEEPWRAFQQLQNLAFSLARIHGRSTVTPHEMELVRRVALFSMPHDRSEVLRLFGQYPHGLSVDCCATGINKSESRARQLLDELHQVKLVSKISGTKNKHTYYPANEFAALVCKPIQPIDHILEV